MSRIENKSGVGEMAVKTNLGPDFIGIGAQRAGTSWLYQCLVSHPEIFMPRKEVHFFDEKFDKGIEWYEGLFEAAEPDQITGEYTPDYLSSDKVINRIFDYKPDVKLIVFLREPLDRAYSAFNLFRSHGHFQGQSFNQALSESPWLIEQGLYSERLNYLLSIFDREQIYIDIYDRISESPVEVFDNVSRFLGLSEGHRPSALHSIRNSSAHSGAQARYKLPALQKALIKRGYAKQVEYLKNTRLFNRFKKWLLSRERDDKVYFDVDKALISLAENDVRELGKIVELDLSKWLKRYQDV